MLLVVLVV